MSTRIVGPAAMASSLQQQQQQLHHLQQQAQLHKMPNSSLAPAVAGQTLAGRSPAQKAEASSSTGLDQFPAGLRVLVVDDDVCCLRVVDKMLKSCGYQVTTCPLATKALELLRANKDAYDLVLSDVHMPDMDGFKLLEYVGLEMDLPVIMMSANGDTAQVMKGVTHGACDYLLKPVRLMELKNIWQHVVRKKRNEHKEAEQSSLEEQRRGADDADYTCSINDTADGSWKHSKKRKEAKEEDDDGEQDNDDPSTLKKPRVVWSVELHQQFVGAVNQLGIDKAFPKRILELMNVQGLTRENVASHLQKYRLYLKRLSGVAHQAGGPFGGPADSFVQMNALEGVGDFRAMAASGQLAQLTPQALLQLGRINGGQNGLGLSNMDPMFLHMSGIQAGNPGLVARPRLPQSLLNMQPSILQTLPNGLELDALCQPPQMGMGVGQGPMDDGLHALQQQFAATMGPAAAAAANLNGNLTSHQNNGSLMLQLMQQQQQVQGVGGNVNLQPAGLLGPHMLSNGISLGRAGPLPNLATASMGNGGSSMGGGGGGGSRGMCLPPINTGSGMSSALSGLGRSQSMDGKYVSAQPFAAVTGGMSVPSSPAGMVSPSSMKDLSGVLGGMNEKQVRSVGGNFSALGSLSPGLVQNMSANSRPSWHGQEFVQPLNSPRYGQMNTNFNSGLPRGQGFMGQQGVYHGRLSVESSGAISLSEQSTADSEMKIKEERAVDSLFSGKLDAALMSGRDDDLLNMLMKQTPQEPISLSESDFPLDNLYVK